MATDGALVALTGARIAARAAALTDVLTAAVFAAGAA